MARVKEQQSFVGALGSVGVYKRNQGRLTRQLTSIGLGVIAIFGCWTMTQTLLASAPEGMEHNWGYIRYGVPTVLAIVALWAIYRIVNYPKFADFLISVEAEMDKVSWADQPYLIRATGVVLGMMLTLGLFLLACDAVWSAFFRLIGFLRLD